LLSLVAVVVVVVAVVAVVVVENRVCVLTEAHGDVDV